MQEFLIANTLDDDWRPSIKHHVNMNLSAFSGDFRTLRISFNRLTPSGYVCDVRGERWSGNELSVTVENDNGEFAISYACARARREIQRDRRLGRR